MGSEALITVVVFLAVYMLIAFEWLNKAIAALLGVMTLLILGVIDERAAASFIDFETIMLLIGMMGIVAVLKKTGFFAIVTVRIAKLTGGQPLRILVLFCAATALLSAFLDNVTTVLIMVPIIIELTRGMGLDPKIYVVALAMASNLGGTATLVGDPPNIIIGSKVGLTFNQFASYLFIPVVLSTVGVIAYFWATNRDSFKSIDDDLTKLPAQECRLPGCGPAAVCQPDRHTSVTGCGGVDRRHDPVHYHSHGDRTHSSGDRMEHLVVFCRSFHPGGCHGAKGRHRMAGPQHFSAGR